MSAGYQDTYNVRVQHGVLVTCDSAAKQILLHLDDSRDGPNKFVMRKIDGDDTHLFIKSDYVDEVKDMLQEELEKNTFVQDQRT